MDDPQTNVYDQLFTETYLPAEDYALFNLNLPDDKLDKMLINDLDENVQFWNQDPWKLEITDTENVKFFLGEQTKKSKYQVGNDDFIDNRMFASARAILSFATGQLATPEITPSRSDERYVKMARSIQSALYQHAADERVDQKTRAAVLNLIVRKRGYLKLRYDPNAGTYGDVVTDVVDPADLIIDRKAPFMGNPNKIYHRISCSVDELCAKFPDKEPQIKQALSIKQGRYTQMSKFVTYYECWFTYLDQDNYPREGVCWFLPDSHLILDKQPNPNWIYTGDDKKDKRENVLSTPPKPFVWFNYLGIGKSFIDETCLFEQAKPLQEMLNQRNKQFNQNIDFMNGRWVASKKAMTEEDGTKFINKGPKTIALVDADDVGKAVQVLTPNVMPSAVYESVNDLRNEIDGTMGTPSIFRGVNPESQDTLGRDMMLKQQAGMLQDDLVRAVQLGMESYYQILLQMMRVYYTDDYWFQVKGGDGKFDFIMLNGESIDSDVKIGVQVDSTLPLDKAQIRATAMELSKAGKIDILTLLEDLGIPDPEIRADRLLRSQMDPLGYLDSVEQGMDNNDAEVDIALLIDGKDPQERDDYDQGYLEYYNHFLTTNRFSKLPQDAKQRLVAYLMTVQHLATQTANLQETMLNDAGILDQPPAPPLPKKTEQIRLSGNLDPGTSQQLSGVQPPQALPTPGAQAPPQAPPRPPV